MLLEWSWWRRRHQWWARWYHYRKRARDWDAGEVQEQECQEQEQQEPELEEVWRRLEPLLSAAKRSGRPYTQERRLVLEAIVEVMQTDCGWQALPSHFPSWKTVYAQYSRWRKQGIWQKIWPESAQSFSYDELQL
jgi:putative transposase of IS4/5 family DUF4096